MKPLLKQILFAILFINAVLAAEPETGVKPLNKLTINVQSNFFVANDKYNDAYFFPFNPGAEILYERKLTDKVSVSSGANYIYSIWYYSIGIKSDFKRTGHEIFIPVLFNLKLKSKYYFTTGVYSGWLLKGKEQYKNAMNVKKWMDVTEYDHYDSVPKFSADLFLASAYSKPVDNKSSIDFSLFVKYKLADNWMGEIRSKVSFGVKINYSFKI
jgi:hypothetical protein